MTSGKETIRIAVATLCLWVGVASHATAEAADELLSALTTHCFDCHNQDTTEGEFSLQVFLDGSGDAESNAKSLQRIRARVADGEMPPRDSDTLETIHRKKLIASVDSQLQVYSEQLRDDPGEVAMPRLTPYEFRNVIRDLSGGVVTNAGRLLPNEGGAGEGFANVGAAQIMTLPQYEKYVDAAKDALRHMRAYPLRSSMSPIDLVWKKYPRTSVDTSESARKEVTDEIISWYVAQQQKWGAEHRDHLQSELGYVHAAYLEAAWHFANRSQREEDLLAYCSVPLEFGKRNKVPLSPAALKKWWGILNREDKSSPHAVWAAKWRDLAGQSELSPAEVRSKCIAIVSGNDKIIVETEDYAPPYEISFHEAKEEVLEAAEKQGHWPFRIEIGDAKELFLIVTDAGDGNRGEYAVWRRGRFVFQDGSSKPWQDAVKILGARSGNEYPFGFDGEKSNVLGEDAVGAKPPGALKFLVPENAIVFEVDLTLDDNRTKKASIQALVLKKKPRSSSYIPGRFVFGGKKRPVTAGAQLKKEQERALRKRNVSEANKTKIGLNAERNVFSRWDRTPLKSIGGPWRNQDPDKFEPNFPYHYTTSEVLENATVDDLAVLHHLEDRLASLVDGRNERDLEELAAGLQDDFARQAWRRDPTSRETESLLRIFEEARSQGLSFDSSIKSSLLLVLSSPHFIYKQYPIADDQDSKDPNSTVELSSHALATRLSFFLWGSLPDERLRNLANLDKLRDPNVLRSEARRMLADDRAGSLASDFAAQLWDFADFETFNNPDEKRFPEFTPELRNAMALEVETFLADLFQNDRPLTGILRSDYTFANRELAEHYGINSDDRASEMKRVHLPEERGGLATMGLFLTKRSLPLRTSPVQRGVWVLENLLGRHLPNPPADVPSLSEDETNSSGENIRQQLERHREDAQCASCHDKIDPLGISLESFDAIGRWREAERDGSALATVAHSHDGVRLNGSIGLQEYLIQHQDEFLDHFNRKLLGYALGRSVHIGDQALLNRMKDRLRDEQFRFSVLVDEIVASPQFTMTRSDVE